MTPGTIIAGACARAGLTQQAAAYRSAIKPATWSRRMRDGSFTVPELRRIHRVVHLTPNEAWLLVGGKL